MINPMLHCVYKVVMRHATRLLRIQGRDSSNSCGAHELQTYVGSMVLAPASSSCAPMGVAMPPVLRAVRGAGGAARSPAPLYHYSLGAEKNLDLNGEAM